MLISPSSGVVDLRHLDTNIRSALFRALPDQAAVPDALSPDLTSFGCLGKDHGGQGDLSSFAGTSSKEWVEWVERVGPENVALSLYRIGNKGLWEKPQHGS
jgi:hypothetical protein